MLASISAHAQNNIQDTSTSSIIGDLNNDNKVDASDVVVLVNLINDLSNYDNLVATQINLVSNVGLSFAKVDVNQDGYVNSVDIDALIRIIMNEDNVRFAAVDIREDTEYGDVLLLSEDGGYYLYDEDNGSGYSVFYIFGSPQDDINQGLIIFIDKNGDPLMASTPEGHLIFKNVIDNFFDFAYIDNQNNVSFYEGINYSFQEPSFISTRGLFDSYKNAFSGEWDEHRKKAFGLYGLKVFSFLLTAIDAVLIQKGKNILDRHGLIYTFLDEINKSTDSRYKWINTILNYAGIASTAASGLNLSKYLKTGNFEFSKKSYTLSALAYRLNKYADDELDKMGTFEPYIAPHFDGEEWQITLDPDVVDFPLKESYDVVDIHSKAKWEIDMSKLDSWCEVTKYDDQVYIRVKENKKFDDRCCFLEFYCPFTEDIKRVSLKIYQRGSNNYELSKSEILFTPTHLSERVNWNTTGVSKCEIISCPNWCKISGTLFELNINAEESLYEERDSAIRISGIVDGKKIERVISIIQKPLCPDTNHPHMIDLGLPSGTKWSCCNAGASSPEEKGNYYSWGNTTPLSKDGTSYYDDYNYPYFEWKDLNNNGSKDTGETFIKYDEAYSSAVSANWGNGSMPSNVDYDELKELGPHKKSSLGNISGEYFTGENGNSIFIPYESYGYWTHFHDNSDKKAWICNMYFETGGANISCGPFDERGINYVWEYSKGRPVRPVSK